MIRLYPFHHLHKVIKFIKKEINFTETENKNTKPMIPRFQETEQKQQRGNSRN